jgi:hypothetical protein
MVAQRAASAGAQPGDKAQGVDLDEVPRVANGKQALNSHADLAPTSLHLHPCAKVRRNKHRGSIGCPR